MFYFLFFSSRGFTYFKFTTNANHRVSHTYSKNFIHFVRLFHVTCHTWYNLPFALYSLHLEIYHDEICESTPKSRRDSIMQRKYFFVLFIFLFFQIIVLCGKINCCSSYVKYVTWRWVWCGCTSERFILSVICQHKYDRVTRKKT